MAAAVATIEAAAAPPPGAGGPAPSADAPQVEAAALDAAERLADGDTTMLQSLTEAELGDLFALLFGLAADYRGPHWELDAKAALRLGRWVKKALDRHGLAWFDKWLPDIMAAGLLLYEVHKRYRQDVRVAEPVAA